MIPPDRLGQLRRQVIQRKTPSSGETPPQAVLTGDMARRIALEDEGEASRSASAGRRSSTGSGGLPSRRGSIFGGSEPAARLPISRSAAGLLHRPCSGLHKSFDQAIDELQRSIRLDPTAAYTYNALGIAYLEKGDYRNARLAFEDAIQRSPKWAYPRHNLALVQTQAGNYEEAIAAYREAIVRVPDYFYLPYNLGLLLHRMNRLDDAAAEYLEAERRARSARRSAANPSIALGLLKFEQRRWRDSESYYRRALAMPAPELTRRTARHNLAALLARRASGWAEAERLWRENGDYLPSRIALAEALSGRKETAKAISEYRAILALAPDHLPARLQLASELERSGQRDSAIVELRAAMAQHPEIALIRERSGRGPGRGRAQAGRSGCISVGSRADTGPGRTCAHPKSDAAPGAEVIMFTAKPLVFLSYSRKDQDKVAGLRKQLASAGVRTWLDTQDIVGGEWRSAIKRGLRQSNFFIACLSKNTEDRGEVLQYEWDSALEIQRERLEGEYYLIPARLEPCELPDSLRHLQCLDLYEPDGWDRLKRLLRTKVRRLPIAAAAAVTVILGAVFADAFLLRPSPATQFLDARVQGRSATPRGPSRIGITLWKMEPSKQTDPPAVREIVHPAEPGQAPSGTAEWTPVRLPAGGSFRLGRSPR